MIASTTVKTHHNSTSERDESVFDSGSCSDDGEGEDNVEFALFGTDADGSSDVVLAAAL